MNLNSNVFDLWVFQRSEGATKYLLLHTSSKKARKYFNEARFWQIPSGFVKNDENIISAIEREIDKFGLKAKSIWAAEYSYTIYNRRYDEIQIITVFATETENFKDIDLSWEYSEYGWFSADECEKRILFRGLKEGLRSTQEYITEISQPVYELKLK